MMLEAFIIVKLFVASTAESIKASNWAAWEIRADTGAFHTASLAVNCVVLVTVEDFFTRQTIFFPEKPAQSAHAIEVFVVII